MGSVLWDGEKNKENRSSGNGEGSLFHKRWRGRLKLLRPQRNEKTQGKIKLNKCGQGMGRAGSNMVCKVVKDL
jgi:hypothetical protein